MERTRLVLIFSALCLALVFSVSSVEAQVVGMCMAGGNDFDWPTILPERCDRDGDCFVKDNNPCKSSNDLAGIDCDDSDPNLNADCSGGDPEPEPTTKTPVIVTFADLKTDSIQSDHKSGYDTNGNPKSPLPYKHDGEKTGVSAILDGQFDMILRQGGIRKLFINFGPLVNAAGEIKSNGDYVKDEVGVVVECPFPLLDPDGNPFRTPPDYPPGSCSALVQAVLTEHDVFDADDGIPDPVVHVQDMDPNPLCDNPDEICADIKVRSNFVYDIAFTLRRSAKGVKTNKYRIAFNAKEESCLVDAPAGFPDFLNIIAVGDPDTWHIGTFDRDLMDFGRIACLLKAEGGSGQPDHVVGFFLMSFMYTITICDDCPSP